MKITGYFSTGEVYVNGKWLDPAPSQELWNHSPTGFMWGYGGSGPAQLALAILLRATSRDRALKYHQQFKWEIIAALPQADFEININVAKWVEEHRVGEHQ